MTLKIILPFADPSVVQEASPMPDRPVMGKQASWRPVPEKPVIGLIDNGKLKADLILTKVGERLVERGAAERYVMHSKRSMEPITPEALEAMLAEAHVVVTAIGDCGGCTASSTTDALRSCEQGVPGFVIATERFRFLVEATDDAYEIDGLNKLYVDHPIWSRDEAWFDATAERLADAILAGLAGIAPEVAASDSGAGTATPMEAAPVEAVLADLKAGMDADGYDMDIAVHADTLAIAVRARDAAGKLCLMPEDAFAQYVARALKNAGISIPTEGIEVNYPARTTA